MEYVCSCCKKRSELPDLNTTGPGVIPPSAVATPQRPQRATLLDLESNPDDETDLFLKIEAETSQTKEEISNSPVCPANDEPLDFGQGIDLLNTQIEELDRAVSDDERSLTNM